MRTSRVLFLSLCLLAAAAFNANAQTGTSGEDNSAARTTISQHVFGLGFNASLATGVGFSFRHHLPDIPFGYQITGMGWKTDDFTFYNFGLELQYDFFVLDKGRLYGLAGGSKFYHSDTAGVNTYEGSTRLGFGVGYEFSLLPSLGISLTATLTSFQPSGQLLPLPTAGIHYYFR